MSYTRLECDVDMTEEAELTRLQGGGIDSIFDAHRWGPITEMIGNLAILIDPKNDAPRDDAAYPRHESGPRLHQYFLPKKKADWCGHHRQYDLKCREMF